MFMDNKFYNCVTFLCICVYDCVCGYTCMYLCLVWKLKVYLGVASIQLSRCYFDLCVCGVCPCVDVYDLMLGVLLNCSSPHILRHMSPELTYSADLAS